MPSIRVPLDAAQESRFEGLMADLDLIDMHQHTMVMPESVDDFVAYAIAGFRQAVDLAVQPFNLPLQLASLRIPGIACILKLFLQRLLFTPQLIDHGVGRLRGSR